MLEKIGIDSVQPSQNPLVSLVTCTNRPDMISNILHNYSHQTWENRELIIVIDCLDNEFQANRSRTQRPRRRNIHLRWLMGLSLGHCFNLGMEFQKEISLLSLMMMIFMVPIT